MQALRYTHACILVLVFKTANPDLLMKLSCNEGYPQLLSVRIVPLLSFSTRLTRTRLKVADYTKLKKENVKCAIYESYRRNALEHEGSKRELAWQTRKCKSTYSSCV